MAKKISFSTILDTKNAIENKLNATEEEIKEASTLLEQGAVTEEEVEQSNTSAEQPVIITDKAESSPANEESAENLSLQKEVTAQSETPAQPESVVESETSAQPKEPIPSSEQTESEASVHNDTPKRKDVSKKKDTSVKKSKKEKTANATAKEGTIGVSLLLPKSTYKELMDIRWEENNIPLRHLLYQMIDYGMEAYRKGKLTIRKE